MSKPGNVNIEDWVSGLLDPNDPGAAAPVAQQPPAASARPVAPVVATARPVDATPPPADEPAPTDEELADMAGRYVTFSVEHEVYALDVLRVREVLRSAEVVPVPGAPGSVLGVINLRGSIVPVVDARHRLGLAPACDSRPGRVLVLECGKQVVGLRVDAVADVTKVRLPELEPPPAVGVSDNVPFLRGVVRREDGFILLVDVDELLPRPCTATPGMPS